MPNAVVPAATATRLLPPQLREARLLPETFNAEARTIEVVWTTGSRVRRYDWWLEEYYDEELQVDTSAVDLTRLNSGSCAVLDSHRTYGGLDAQLGVVDRAWIAGGVGHAQLRLSARDDLAGIVADIVNGIIRNISVGYTVQRYVIDKPEGQPAIYRAVEWTPHELSFVTVPADAAATTRNAPAAQGAPCVFARAVPQEIPMPQPATTRAADPVAPQDDQNPNAVTPPTQAPTVNDASNARAAEIVELAARHGMTERTADWLRAGHTVEKVRGLILDELATRDTAAGGHINRISNVTEDEQDLQRSAFAHALLGRAQVIDPSTKRVFAVTGDNPLRGLTLLDMARRSLERAGVRTDGMQKLELVGRAFTQSGSDFPILLENAMHKALQSAYALAPDTWSRWCATGTVSDFRAHNRYRLGSIGNLDALNELGEFKNKTIPDGEKASITAGTKGNIINLSRQAIINDDLGAFIGLAVTFGRAAKRTIEADAYAYLASNPTMSDGIALFHASHGNLGTTGAPSVTAIDEARVLMASQKDVSGNDFLDLRPAVWLGPLSYGSAARVANNSEYDPDANNKLQRPNAVRGLFRDVVDTPRIADTKWYMFADPNDAPVIEVAFLDGVTEPFLDQEDGFSVDGVRWKARLDYGIAAIDYRGAARNG
ncbi:peptidase S14 [Xanthomonas sacchari]|uniref:prohead protease/major capsid protein fusion protein n=1 Tax=Xanthomonas sacchari TaxID=56458 RepID=UPI00225E21AD|nr:prohead protease/major capsid protein fusion protein [Xanthomonas sacchari]UYK82302.1 peptidase S14 [Xanthomonas sacchari]